MYHTQDQGCTKVLDIYFGGTESCGKHSPDQVRQPNLGLIISVGGDMA